MNHDFKTGDIVTWQPTGNREYRVTNHCDYGLIRLESRHTDNGAKVIVYARPHHLNHVLRGGAE